MMRFPALLAMLALPFVPTLAVAGQLVDVKVVSPDSCPFIFKAFVVETGTEDFRSVVSAQLGAIDLARSTYEGCLGAHLKIEPLE